MAKSWVVRGAESAYRARRRMQLVGVTPNGHPLWERWEVEPVVGRYPDYRSIFPELDRRTHAAVYNKAGRLGITVRGARRWSDNEKLQLRKVYPKGTRVEIEAAFPGRSYGAIRKMANARRIFRERPDRPLTGITLLDQVLSRADASNITLVELDTIARTGAYFQRSSWKRSVNQRNHCLAAIALGGTVRARFQ